MKSILITIAISVYMTFMVVTIQVANKQTLATSDVTLDIVEVMTRAFDESEGGEGGDNNCPPFPKDYFAGIECDGGIDFLCAVKFYLNGIHVHTYMFAGTHSQEWRYDCIPDVIINPE